MKLSAVLVVSLVILASPSPAAVIITEFVASNSGLLRDVDGDSPDWIELFNPASTAINLEGWHLTDSSTNLTRWAFPATNLGPRAFLIVFASGKDRVVA